MDAVQKRAVRMGFIKEFVPIEQHIKVKDARLLNNITKTGSKHRLYDILPHRRDYCSEVAVKKVYGSMFPERLLRKFKKFYYGVTHVYWDNSLRGLGI